MIPSAPKPSNAYSISDKQAGMSAREGRVVRKPKRVGCWSRSDAAYELISRARVAASALFWIMVRAGAESDRIAHEMELSSIDWRDRVGDQEGI